MLFSSLCFLLYFFPIVILVHYILPHKLQNGFLFLASLIFYAWGEVRYVPLFFALLTLDWGVGLLLERTEKPVYRRLLLLAGIAADIGSLVYYKYSAFLLETLGVQTSWAAGITLPLGISFFTFQAVGYLVDVYRRQTVPEKSLVSFGTFLFLFPQLIAGPIIRYSDMREALHCTRRPDGEALERGLSLFVAGLASKVLLANPLGAMGEELRAVTGDSVCMFLYLCVFCLHLYFDFMGYSVMAVFMGRMLGFSFPRNFKHPYAASSVSDFWKRWHITLCGWFRDYVYFPLGGSRKGPVRAVVNSLIVWFLTGFWHGAGWTFILWGLSCYFLLTLDKSVLVRFHAPKIFRRLLILTALPLSQTLFTADTLQETGAMWQTLLSFQATSASLFWLRDGAGLLIVAILMCIPAVVDSGKRWLNKLPILRYCAVLGLLILCLAALSKSTYNPFLYFRF